jgi:hypothetical protein
VKSNSTVHPCRLHRIFRNLVDPMRGCYGVENDTFVLVDRHERKVAGALRLLKKQNYYALFETGFQDCGKTGFAGRLNYGQVHPPLMQVDLLSAHRSRTSKFRSRGGSRWTKKKRQLILRICNNQCRWFCPVGGRELLFLPRRILER